ncbi:MULTISPECIES: FxsA family protein [unclassified Mycolicibacterium]|uniref:FxsA family protein n=1 Tax=unclassified Mycolicibacterium TaxID=2636767 RepID=UPI0012DE38A5|nr:MULTISPECIES: FxsA family protein [unclassified Mycolicibacterium]MUL82528.1 membrane protein FxsA [Mycolicibacterium sp. CBMA 329]MUL91340.1 membrane protein FxsA [Mycolicibacterium sp. CBMA 331]MUM01463.1 membrane protein FxsA [Mycolicibacterium sp. CBMA 334]MUM29636.1 membrane protein FxsA [Mycolicibacterium sp. CBMA 295]MUM41764.1 membrane protein FxsA [Mycolicibacterium sp. CBMA 247]
MAKRLFLIYALVEMAVMVALVATIGFGYTVLLLLASFLIGLALAGSQLNRHIRRLRTGLSDPHGAVSDSVLVALGAVLVVIPGLASSVLGALLLLPPTRAAARPVLTGLVARRMPLVAAAPAGFGWTTGTAGSRHGAGDYIDGEVIDVTDVDPHRLPPQA